MKTYTADPELTALLKEAAEAGERLRVRTDDSTYELEVWQPLKKDIWKDYDPEAVQRGDFQNLSKVTCLPDTDVVIYHLNGITAAQTLLQRLRQVEIAMSAISYMEAVEGFARDSDPAFIRQQFDMLVGLIPVFPFSNAEAE